MDDSPDSLDKPAPPPRPSSTPSWVLLGFVIGALFVWALPREDRTKPPPAAPATIVHLDRPKATDIEAVFAEWGKNAVWEHDLTEVALWDVDKKSYTLFYEILRSGDACYFRSIPQLTRPILTHGIRGHAPLLLTETEEMRREWLMRGEVLMTEPKPAGSDEGR